MSEGRTSIQSLNFIDELAVRSKRRREEKIGFIWHGVKIVRNSWILELKISHLGPDYMENNFSPVSLGNVYKNNYMKDISARAEFHTGLEFSM